MLTQYAERERRSAVTSFLAAPLMLGYWLAYQVEGEGQRLAAQLLPATALMGSVIGWIGGRSADARTRRRQLRRLKPQSVVTRMTSS